MDEREGIEIYCLMGTKLFGLMKKVQEMNSGVGCTTLLMYLMPLKCTLKKCLKW